MRVYTIILENTCTGEIAPSMVTRQITENAARQYAEDAIKEAEMPHIRVHSIKSRRA